MSKENEPRNKAVVHLRRLNKQTYSVDKLAVIFDTSKPFVHKVLNRDWEKYELPKVDKQQKKPFDKVNS